MKSGQECIGAVLEFGNLEFSVRREGDERGKRVTVVRGEGRERRDGKPGREGQPSGSLSEDLGVFSSLLLCCCLRAYSRFLTQDQAVKGMR